MAEALAASAGAGGAPESVKAASMSCQAFSVGTRPVAVVMVPAHPMTGVPSCWCRSCPSAGVTVAVAQEAAGSSASETEMV